MADTTFTDGLQASLAPWGAIGSDWQNANYALGQMVEQVYGIVADQGSPDDPVSYAAGWSTLLNVDTCPTWALPWLGMFVGVFVPPGTDDATARALISNEQGFQRGTLAAITAAAARNLSGDSPQIEVLERTDADGNPDAYHFLVVVLTSQVVSTDALTAAVNAVKPGGVQWTLIETTSWIISELEADYSTITDVEAAFASITALEGDVT